MPPRWCWSLLVDTRKEFEDLASTYLPIAIVVFALACSGRSCRCSCSARAGASRSDREEPPWVPIGYAVVLVAIVAVLVALTFNAQDKISANVTHPGLQVGVTAAKWNWRFDYPAQHQPDRRRQHRPRSWCPPAPTSAST